MKFAKLDPNSDTPKSLEFGDIYFSPDDGIEESKYNFLIGNNLTKRFAKHISSNSAAPFTIAEVGFGTGLNFLLTADLWVANQQENNKRSTLHFVSVEKYPIKRETLTEIYQTQKWQNNLTNQFISKYSDHTEAGVYHYQFEDQYASIRLTLLIGDVIEQFSNYSFSADAWYLDGFAPNKNPEMWQPALFELMAKKSNNETTFATFTAASAVRKELEKAGFQIQKTKGYGKKRERLTGHR